LPHVGIADPASVGLAPHINLHENALPVLAVTICFHRACLPAGMVGRLRDGFRRHFPTGESTWNSELVLFHHSSPSRSYYWLQRA
jgi:hypothetical protein